MAFKMAKGSLFAVLLRSSWWYSVSIGLFILVVSLALTDAKYVVLSLTGSLPFLSSVRLLPINSFSNLLKSGCWKWFSKLKMPAGVISEKIAANYIKVVSRPACLKAMALIWR